MIAPSTAGTPPTSNTTACIRSHRRWPRPAPHFHQGHAPRGAELQGPHPFQGPDGNVGDYPFFTPEFTVAEPALVVSPTKMNVFYRGVPNPVEISVPGVSSDKLDVRITGGHRIKPDGETFIVDPGAGESAEIVVTATLPDGARRACPVVNSASSEFRTPPPVSLEKSPLTRPSRKSSSKMPRPWVPSWRTSTSTWRLR